ncbi:MAG: hypothetical protein KDE57_14295, partial [Calditrichaeota bacterium]|nr:hypothetical protein [Calditrichota bacterium]
LAENSSLYDYTGDSKSYYGSDGAVTVDVGVWAVWSSDVNQDGEVTTTDYTTWYNAARAGQSGYNASDCDLDGQVTTSDYTIWYNNARAGASSQVP